MIGRNQAGGINAYLAEEGMWPEQPYSELLRIAFGMKGVVGGTDHPIMRLSNFPMSHSKRALS